MIEELRREVDRLERLVQVEAELIDMGLQAEAVQVKAMQEKVKLRIRSLVTSGEAGPI